MSAPVPVTTFRNILGESPVWCPLANRLYWLDVRNPAVHRLDPATGEVETWPMPEKLGSLTVCDENVLLVAMQRRISYLDMITRELHDIFVLPEDQPQHRFNDGKCDPAGRFLVGTLKDTSRLVNGLVEGGLPSDPVGGLYQVVADVVHKVVDGLTIPNSLAWSPDGTTMFLSDTARKVIFAYPYDVGSGALGERRLFADVTAHPGKPDGSTVDAEGYLWNAEYGGWRIARYAPDGRLDRVIELPVEQPTSCAFGGEGLATLYVTTATQRIPPDELEQQPLAGMVLALDVGVTGRTEPRYARYPQSAPSSPPRPRSTAREAR